MSARVRLALALCCVPAARADLLVTKQTTKTLLGKVPVFLLTNKDGQPYLTSTKEGDQVGKMFVFLKDAEKSLAELKVMPGASDARMWKTDMNRALRMADREQGSGNYNEQGRPQRMLMRLAPHERQRTNARILFLKKLQPFRAPPTVPVFIAEGLAGQKRGGPVVPLFFSKEELDRTWSRAALKARGAMPAKPTVIVTSLTQVLKAVEEDPNFRCDFFVSEATQKGGKDKRRQVKARILKPRR
ncbi:Tic22-like family-domain-containing protein [Pavlovales sp. CCMP2436]|nr:Tic22-like family-domain-containing protein [Pavlovales sp. CCMP2436]